MAQMRLHRFSYGDKRRNKLNTEMNKMSIRRFLVSFVSVVILLTLAVANTLGQKPARRPDLGAKIVVDQPGSVSAAKLRRSRIGIKLPPAPSEASTGNNLEDILIYRASSRSHRRPKRRQHRRRRSGPAQWPQRHLDGPARR